MLLILLLLPNRIEVHSYQTRKHEQLPSTACSSVLLNHSVEEYKNWRFDDEFHVTGKTQS
ncbi:hypothetical protein RchiOBHm_Chr4g0389391 [Rosa chinensis]|nr:hypothetical protein RchiOBHm_Chr4g0389391 [Rosa chinensis]